LIDETLLNKVADQLKTRALTIATAESCTGGLLAHILTSISGSSSYFERGIVSYSDTAKIELLSVPQETIQKYGAVSEQTASAMALGVRERSAVDIGIAITGIAGPTGGTKEKPVGLVYIGIIFEDQVMVKKFHFSGDRLQNKESTCNAALSLLLNIITR
jgi:nicotinamide-nucleotide amidase